MTFVLWIVTGLVTLAAYATFRYRVREDYFEEIADTIRLTVILLGGPLGVFLALYDAGNRLIEEQEAFEQLSQEFYRVSALYQGRFVPESSINEGIES